MKAMINVGHEISMKEAAEPIAEALVKVLAALSEGRHDREVSIKALDVIGLSAGVNGVAISHCNLNARPEAEKDRPTDDEGYYL